MGGSDITKLPSNYLPCDGRSLSNTTYSSLFGVIGYMYSATNTGSNFNIPNMQSKFAIGSNAINTKQLQTSTLINSVSGGMQQITNAHFPHNHGGPKTITYVRRTGSAEVETQNSVNLRSTDYGQDCGPWTSTNPLGTSNTTSFEYYPPYCIIIYIIRVS